ncbi:hypothetical protein H696_01300 [Fonticula alba]|uniref:Potassium channel domain-containing protein n=1 Tax=Fonticula alba TaxID=691883 RepID=A0A058ZD78_FONAL|nr:hypothetical protein H696_01300 [Fonticula alba]KCV71891.1 hypothetical protein H696_01300 [Fonticula alba]|eukprot:XP_009493469.1 hypothetical protein H696_01300 [Fonticula alba]
MLWLGILGAIMVVVVNVDIVLTVLSNTRPAVVGYLLLLLWSSLSRVWMASRLPDLFGRRGLSVIAPFLLMLILIVWSALLWLSWTFVFFSLDNVVRNSSTGDPVSIITTAYYVGYVFTTVGLGDVQVDTDGFRVLTVIVAFNGILFSSLAVSYTRSALDAFHSCANLATRIAVVGKWPLDILDLYWDGGRWDRVGLNELTQAVAYDAAALAPYVKSSLFSFGLFSYHKSRSALAMIAVFHEAVVLLENVIDIEDSAEAAMSEFLMNQTGMPIAVARTLAWSGAFPLMGASIPPRLRGSPGFRASGPYPEQQPPSGSSYPGGLPSSGSGYVVGHQPVPGQPGHVAAPGHYSYPTPMPGYPAPPAPLASGYGGHIDPSPSGLVGPSTSSLSIRPPPPGYGAPPQEYGHSQQPPSRPEDSVPWDTSHQWTSPGGHDDLAGSRLPPHPRHEGPPGGMPHPQHQPYHPRGHESPAVHSPDPRFAGHTRPLYPDLATGSGDRWYPAPPPPLPGAHAGSYAPPPVGPPGMPNQKPDNATADPRYRRPTRLPVSRANLVRLYRALDMLLDTMIDGHFVRYSPEKPPMPTVDLELLRARGFRLLDSAYIEASMSRGHVHRRRQILMRSLHIGGWRWRTSVLGNPADV